MKNNSIDKEELEKQERVTLENIQKLEQQIIEIKARGGDAIALDMAKELLEYAKSLLIRRN